MELLDDELVGELYSLDQEFKSVFKFSNYFNILKLSFNVLLGWLKF